MPMSGLPGRKLVPSLASAQWLSAGALLMVTACSTVPPAPVAIESPQADATVSQPDRQTAPIASNVQRESSPPAPSGDARDAQEDRFQPLADEPVSAEDEPPAYRERGIASWYGKRFHGRQTALGETYDMFAMSAAHRTLPLPSYARVTHLGNGRSVVVRVNDRGPYHGGRLIDLSYTAARKLNMVNDGAVMVEVEALPPEEQPSPRLIEEVSSKNGPAGRHAAAAGTKPKLIYVQLAAFKARAAAESYVKRARKQLAITASQLSLYVHDELFRVHAGPYKSRGEARNAGARMGKSLGVTPVLTLR
jgi:rare lipoprotein A